MSRPTTAWASAQALWVTAAGWAQAAERRFGHAWVATPDATYTPSETLSWIGTGVADRRRRLFPVPPFARTAAKDALLARASRHFRDVGERPEWRDLDLEFVWQHHDLFHRAGAPLARRRGCPLVSFVDAPQVWEAARWGVHRPGWGHILTRIGELPQLAASDVVVCVSYEVAAEIIRLGVERRRVLVCPTGVDPERFGPETSGDAVRERYGLAGQFVIGWTGSFRSFHGLEVAVEALACLRRDAPDSRLLLVGDGFDRPRIEAVASSMNVADAVIFTGAVPHLELPQYLAAMDVTVLTTRPGEPFHYSPLKLREYLASGRPVVAPRIGDIARTLEDGKTALLFDLGDTTGLARHLSALRHDAELRSQLGRAGRELILKTGTWDVQLERLLEFGPFLEATSARGAASR